MYLFSFLFITVCTVYGSTFQPDLGRKIDGNNIRSLTGLSREECLLACTLQTSFDCKSIDFCDSGCHMANFTALARQDFYVATTGCDHYNWFGKFGVNICHHVFCESVCRRYACELFQSNKNKRCYLRWSIGYVPVEERDRLCERMFWFPAMQVSRVWSRGTNVHDEHIFYGAVLCRLLRPS